MTRCATVALVLLMLPAPAMAEVQPLSRGLNLPIWVEWLRVDQMIADIGFLTPYPDWRRLFGAERLAKARADGFDFIRFPVDPGPLLALGPGADQDRMIADIRMGAQMILDAGLTVVVDLHSIPRPDEDWGTDAVVAGLWPDYLALVGRIGAALDGLDPSRTAFEPLNEPTHDCAAIADGSPQEWPAQLAQMHASARTAAPDLTLVLSGACWGGAYGLAALDPATISDPNVIWSFHSYDPFSFTHQGAEWTFSPLKYLSGLPYPPEKLTTDAAKALEQEAADRMAAAEGAADRAAISAVLDDYRSTPKDEIAREIRVALDWARTHGIPPSRLLLGEFGTNMPNLPPGPSLTDRAAFLSDKRLAAEGADIPWAVWSFEGSMRVTQDSPVPQPMEPVICTALGLAGCAP